MSGGGQPDLFRPGVSLPDLDRDAFVAAIAKRFEAQTDLAGRDAAEYARVTLDEFLTNEAIEFGAPDYGWTAADAATIADEDIECW